jgi:hypothetical protein
MLPSRSAGAAANSGKGRQIGDTKSREQRVEIGECICVVHIQKEWISDLNRFFVKEIRRVIE